MKEIGPIVPIVTPCRPDGEIDIDGFHSVCQEMLQVGCQGIFVAGSTGRGPWFSRKDREMLCRTACDLINGAVPLLAGCMSSGLPGMLENAHAMHDAGAQIAIATVPGYFHYNQDEVEKIYLKFADASPIPIIVYDIPEFTNFKLGEKMVLRLANHGNILGIKDSSGDFERFKHLVDVLGEYDRFYLLQGKENLLADSLQMGASGFVVSMIHLYPPAFVGVYRAVRAGNLELAQRMQVEINKAMKLVRGSIETRPESSTLFHMLNYALRLRGVCNNVLLDHDDFPPDWLVENSLQATEACRRSSGMIST